MDKNSNKSNGFVKGLLIGGLIGAAAAMLFAPMSGKSLRKKIGRKTDDILDDVNQYAQTGKEKAEELFREGREKVGSLIEDAKKIIKS
jgi:gas vesicle protein